MDNGELTIGSTVIADAVFINGTLYGSANGALESGKIIIKGATVNFAEGFNLARKAGTIIVSSIKWTTITIIFNMTTQIYLIQNSQ